MIGEVVSPPTEEDVVKVCKAGQGSECCRYLGMSGGAAPGWTCLKHSRLRAYIDGRVSTGTMGAKGDNCPGKGERA